MRTLATVLVTSAIAGTTGVIVAAVTGSPVAGAFVAMPVVIVVSYAVNAVLSLFASEPPRDE